MNFYFNHPPKFDNNSELDRIVGRIMKIGLNMKYGLSRSFGYKYDNERRYSVYFFFN